MLSIRGRDDDTKSRWIGLAYRRGHAETSGFSFSISSHLMLKA